MCVLLCTCIMYSCCVCSCCVGACVLLCLCMQACVNLCPPLWDSPPLEHGGRWQWQAPLIAGGAQSHVLAALPSMRPLGGPTQIPAGLQFLTFHFQLRAWDSAPATASLNYPLPIVLAALTNHQNYHICMTLLAWEFSAGKKVALDCRQCPGLPCRSRDRTRPDRGLRH